MSSLLECVGVYRCTHTSICLCARVCFITAIADVFVMPCTQYVLASLCVPAYLFLCVCDLTVMAFQLVGSHAELVSNCLEILNSTCCRLLREKERGGESVCWFLHEDWNSFTRFPFSLTLDIPLEPPCVCVWVCIHLWNVSYVSNSMLDKLRR